MLAYDLGVIEFSESPTLTPFVMDAVVAGMLDQGRDPNETDPTSGETPLHLAAALGLNDVVRLPLDRGADPNRIDDSGSTPLESVTNGEVFDVLVEAGARAADGWCPGLRPWTAQSRRAHRPTDP